MKYFAAVILSLLVLVTGFYFWGSNNLYPDSDYSALYTYSAASKEYQAGDTLKVLTYNIGFLSGMDNNLAVPQNEALYLQNMRNAKQLVKALQADFIGFQEIDFGSSRSLEMNMLDSLATAGNYPIGIKAVNWDKQYVPFPYGFPSVNYGQMLSGQALLSKFPVTSYEREVLEAPEAAPFYYKAFYLDRLLQTVKIPLAGDTLVLMNIHLEAFDEITREKQAKVVLEKAEQYAANYPTLLIGDFNARPTYASDPLPNDKAMQYFEAAQNLLPAISPEAYKANESAYFTFDTKNPIEQLDYIFYSRGKIRPLKARVVSEAKQISDHYPVLFSFVIQSDSLAQ